MRRSWRAQTWSPLAQMAHDAFYEHRPMTLSPDAVWFTIAQGFATHVNLNAEALRHRFVRHEGKKDAHRQPARLRTRQDKPVARGVLCVLGTDRRSRRPAARSRRCGLFNDRTDQARRGRLC